MGNKIATEKTLSELHGMTADLMKKRLCQALAGDIEMAAAELSSITRFLKDNGIECTREDMENQFKGVIKLAPPSFESAEDIEALG